MPETDVRLDESTFLRGGWRIVARKEAADHIQSARFTVLVAILAVAAAGAVYAAANGIRDVAPRAAEVSGLFLKLFTITEDPVPFPFLTFVGFLGPLLGIMFGFDAISGERSQGTLPRLLSHPIHRDQVIVGKFAGGLVVIGLTVTALTALVSGIGIFRLGLAPEPDEAARLIVWLIAAVAYLGVWLALAMLASVTMQKAATSALVGLAVWLGLVLFGPLLFTLGANAVAGSDPAQLAETEVMLSRLSPATLYQEASTVLLDPSQRAVGLVSFDQIDRALVSELTLAQSLGVIWPQIVGLLALTCVLFAWAFVAFMRQEVRA
jgi:ABC-2 type transport system permease protein